MNQCEYALIEEADFIFMKKRYFIQIYFNRHYCLKMEISEQQYNDILEEEKQK